MVFSPSLILCFFSFGVTFDVVGAFCSCSCRSLEPAAKPANKTPGGPSFLQASGEDHKSGVSDDPSRVVAIVTGSGPNARAPLDHLDFAVSIIAHGPR